MKKVWESKYFRWGITGLIAGCGIVLFVYMLFNANILFPNIGKIISMAFPVIYGLIIAYIIAPLLSNIEKKCIRPLFRLMKIDPKRDKKMQHRVRRISIFITYLIILLIGYLFFSIVMPEVINSITSIIDLAPTYAHNMYSYMENLLSDNPDVAQTVENYMNNYSENIATILQDKVMPQMNTLIYSVSQSIISVVKTFYNLAIGLIISIYVLYSKEKFARQGKKLVYGLFERKTANHVIYEFRFIHKTFIGFLTGKIIDSAIIGVICYVGCLILDMPYTLLVSVIIGITNIIPFFGPIIGAIPCSLIIVVVDPMKALYFIIMILLLQTFDGNYLGPKILGQSTGIEGFWVIFAITFFGNLWGFIGMIVGVPLTAIFYASVKAINNNMLRKRKLNTDTEAYRKLVYINEEDEYIYEEINSIEELMEEESK